MSEIRVRRTVEVQAPAAAVWDYITDWPAQGEWIPMTRVEREDSADRIGGRFRAWSGIGRVGFWDTLTITAWERGDDGSGRCEVLHTGSVVRGTGEFAVTAVSSSTSRFVLAEALQAPAARLGGAAWKVVRPLVERLADRALSTMRDRVEARAHRS